MLNCSKKTTCCLSLGLNAWSGAVSQYSNRAVRQDNDGRWLSVGIVAAVDIKINLVAKYFDGLVNLRNGWLARSISTSCDYGAGDR